jgi:surfeit locus 1 family protein
MRRLIGALVLGLGGAAILVALGVWQLHRLEWKAGILARMEARIGADPVDLPADPDPSDNYRAVALGCGFEARELFVLTSRRGQGPGYRLIVPCSAAHGRRVMVDLGFVPQAQRTATRAYGGGRVIGNLHWPDEIDPWFTPEPDLAANLWFARDVPAMARVLETEPVLVVARELGAGPGGVTPWPVDTAGIPDNHRQYAITWFAMAVLWLGMTALLVWRISRRTG